MKRIASWTDLPEDVRSSHDGQLPSLLDAMERGERPPLSGAQGRETLELIAALYRAAFTGLPVVKDEVVSGNPFYQRMQGDGPPWT